MWGEIAREELAAVGCDAADAVTRFYQENGYPVARAVLPAQKVEKGMVRIEVIEGRVGDVRFEGNRRYDPDRLRGRLATLVPGELITIWSHFLRAKRPSNHSS